MAVLPYESVSLPSGDLPTSDDLQAVYDRHLDLWAGRAEYGLDGLTFV